MYDVLFFLYLIREKNPDRQAYHIEKKEHIFMHQLQQKGAVDHFLENGFMKYVTKLLFQSRI